MTTVARLLSQGESILSGKRIPEARKDARLILQHVLDLDHAAMISSSADPVDISAAARFHGLIARRARGEPVSRIIGRREFHGFDFIITPAVLDPRPETELLVDRVLADVADPDAAIRFADIGTGSGAIAITLLRNLPNASGIAADISRDALEVASLNAVEHGVASRLELLHSDLFSDLRGNFDVVISNPPYVRRDEIPLLEKEVRLNDPLDALDGGPDGLDAYRGILDGALRHLQPHGTLYLELGAGQLDAVSAMARRVGWAVSGSWKDLSGIDRVLALRKEADLSVADAGGRAHTLN
jgi:release factor glutamine methyltransferase